MPIFINLAYKVNILDVPDQRKIHLSPIPRVGGIAMGLGAILPIILWAPIDQFVKSMLIGAGIVVLFGLVDDVKHIGFKPKFAGQIIAALIVILYGGLKIKTFGTLAPQGFLLPDWISIPLTLVIVVAVTNAINLSDGLDGLAGGISLLTFLCVGYLAYSYDFQALETMSVAMIGAIFGLLRYNTHPAVVFMGDSGSQLLGFFAITISLSLTQQCDQLSPFLPLYIIGLPVIDTLWVIIRRITLHKSPFVADKNHLHHKLMRLGLYHSESVISIYLLHASLVCIAFIFRSKSDWFLLSLYCLLCGIMATTAFFAVRSNWKIKRYDFIDKIIKGRLRTLKDETNLIKFTFKSGRNCVHFPYYFFLFSARTNQHLFFIFFNGIFVFDYFNLAY